MVLIRLLPPNSATYVYMCVKNCRNSLPFKCFLESLRILLVAFVAKHMMES